MKSKLWKDCLFCKSECCQWKIIAFPIFVTTQEKRNLPKINTKFPCLYYNSKTTLCDIHNKRPIDCRLFPFDVHKINGKFYWKIWKLNCPIIKNKSLKELEPYLQEHEKNIVPKFKNNFDKYWRFQLKKFEKYFKYEILREIRL